MSLRFSIAVQSIIVNCCGIIDLNARTRNKCAKRRGYVSPWMLVERFEHKHALGQNRRLLVPFTKFFWSFQARFFEP